jgi:AcrR family transcriptional regulator
MSHALLDALLVDKTKGERTRIKLLWASLECCAEEGFEGLSFMKVAELAQTDKRTALHHFNTRQELLMALLDFLGVVGRAYTDQFIEARDHIKDPLERYVRATFDWFRSDPNSARCWLAAVQRATYDRDFKIRMEEISHAARQRITRLLPKGRRVDPRAYRIHAAIAGCLFSVSISDQTLEAYEEHAWSMTQLIAAEGARPRKR